MSAVAIIQLVFAICMKLWAVVQSAIANRNLDAAQVLDKLHQIDAAIDSAAADLDAQHDAAVARIRQQIADMRAAQAATPGLATPPAGASTK